MKLLVKGRRAGKTTEAIKLAKEKNGIIFVHNVNEKKRLMQEYNMKENQIFVYSDSDRLRGIRIENKPIIIENLDIFIRHFLPNFNVTHATMTADINNFNGENE